MAFQTGTATSLANLISTLDTFLTSNGWTQDQADAAGGKYAWNKNSQYVQVRWDTGSPNNLGVYQSLAFDGTGTDPGNHTDDDGNGEVTGTDANFPSGRYVEITNGSSMEYWFFENDANPHYVHIVLETGTNVYVHFGFGVLDKVGDWTGGEYAYGHNVNSDSNKDTRNTYLLDGLKRLGTAKHAATLHLEGFPDQAVAEKWGQIWGTSSTTPPTDRAGEAKCFIQGGYRGGLQAAPFGFQAANAASGLVAMYPIVLYLVDNSKIYLLGQMADVRGVSMKLFAPEQEITIGSDTWVVFPPNEKNSSSNQGIAYKKVTT